MTGASTARYEYRSSSFLGANRNVMKTYLVYTVAAFAEIAGCFAFWA